MTELNIYLYTETEAFKRRKTPSKISAHSKGYVNVHLACHYKKTEKLH